MSVKKYLDNLEDLSGKKIIVTGGTSGIGLSIVKELLIKGADVVILARNQDKANKVKLEYEAQYKNRSIYIVQYDQSDDEYVFHLTSSLLNLS